MVVTDPAFKTAGRTPGTEIWRVKNFRVIPVEKETFGVFFGGDSYIVLNTYGSHSDLRHNVHMWLGEETTTDEAGTAAIKMVELDDLLGGGPVQYREVQGHESSLFLSYFRQGLRYMKGGFDSGFHHHVKGKVRPRLFHCKGRRTVRVQEVDVSRDSLNLGDAFILDTGDVIYAWLPPKCNRLERIKGIEQARNIRDQERSGRAQIQVLDSDWDSNREFWEFLPAAGDGKIRSESQGGEDEDFMQSRKVNASLWRVCDASGKMSITKVAEGKLSPDLLDSKDAFILYAASSGLFVWIGKGCTINERQNAMKWASEYLVREGRPKWVQVVRVLEGNEPSLFTQWFQSTPMLKGPPSGAQKHVQAKQFVRKFEPRLFHCSDASGKLSIIEISNFSQEDLQPDDVMILDSGESVFVWNGGGANDTEKQAGMLIAKKYVEVNATPRASTSIKVLAQGKESREFQELFKGWDSNLWKQSRQLVQSVEDAMKSLRF
jgi:hypothetical protein